MPDTLTSFYEFILPEISGSPETWGNKWNSNLQAMDALFRTTRNYIENAEPIGLIKMWAGLIDAIPANHAFCDGTIQNGVQTPDLRERFIVGGKTGSTLFEPGDFGGAVSSATGSTALTMAQMPSHRHDDGVLKHNHTYPVITPGPTGVGGVVIGSWDGSSLWGSNSAIDTPTTAQPSLPTGGGLVTGFTGGNITTPVEGVGDGHAHSVNALPPYYTLAFIMRVSYPWT